jgi:hypothetical protein
MLLILDDLIGKSSFELNSLIILDREWLEIKNYLQSIVRK